MNIVCFGQQDWNGAWVTKQHLLSRLARRGHRVLFVDPTSGPITEVRRIASGLHVLKLPDRPRHVPARLFGKYKLWRLRREAERLGLWAPVALCLWPTQRWLIEALDARSVVYFAEDDNSAFGGIGEGFAQHQRREERLLLESCDLALAVSPTLLDKFREVQPHSYLQENGVDPDAFSALALAAAERPEDLAEAPRPLVGFVGQIDERMDQELVLAIAKAVGERGGGVALCGRIKKGVDVARLREAENVIFTGFVEYRDLPGIYASLDVGLVPYVRSPLTESCNPLKVYEYLAAGLATVATDLPGLGSAREHIEACGTREAFVAAVLRSLDDPTAGRDERRRAARAASWQRRTDAFELRLHEANAIADARRAERGERSPRFDRPGHVAVRVEPRLDGKDESVRAVSGNYERLGLSGQQKLVYAATRVLGRGYYAVRRITRLLKGDRRNVARILVVRNGHLGDTVVFFPTLRALKKQFPTAKIVIGVAPGSSGGSLLEGSPYVDSVVELNFFNKGRAARWQGAMRLLIRGFDLVVTGVWYFNLPEAVFSGAPKRLGLYDGHPLQAYADHVVPIDPNLHEAELNLSLVDAAFGTVPAAERVPHLDLDEHAVVVKGDAFRAKIGISVDDEVVAMHPGSKRPSRRWPAERFAGLAAKLLAERPNLKVVFTAAGKGEDDLVREIIAGIPEGSRDRAINAFEAGGLIGLTGFYDKCRCLVCNDTGVMHVARARGVPVVAIVGPENDRRWGPYPLGDSPAVVVRQQVPGTPHNKDVCEWNLSLASIPVERVCRHVRGVLDGNLGIEPVQLDGRRFWPVLRDVERSSFEALVESGLRVPRVAVVMPRTPELLGLTGGGAPATDAKFQAAVMGARRQRYPALDVRLVDDDVSVTAAEGELVLAERSVGDTSAADAAWSRLLASTSASLFLIARPGRTLPISLVSSLVSAYLRGPNAEAVSVDGPVGNLEVIQAWKGDFAARDLLVTRELLRTLLDHPIPLAPAVPPEPSLILRAAAL